MDSFIRSKFRDECMLAVQQWIWFYETPKKISLTPSVIAPDYLLVQCLWTSHVVLYKCDYYDGNDDDDDYYY